MFHIKIENSPRFSIGSCKVYNPPLLIFAPECTVLHLQLIRLVEAMFWVK